jgi:hypothetical protein
MIPTGVRFSRMKICGSVFIWPSSMIMRINNMSWDAFVTLHWFMTGCRIISECKHPLSNQLYYWWLILDDNKKNEMNYW